MQYAEQRQYCRKIKFEQVDSAIRLALAHQTNNYTDDVLQHFTVLLKQLFTTVAAST